MGRKPNTTCDACSAPIYKRPSDLIKFEHKYCSQLCYRKDNPPITNNCVDCGKVYRPDKRASKTCSRACSNKSRAGTRYKKHGYNNSSQAKLERLRKEFNFTSCMVDGCNYSNTYDVHRYVPGREGGKYEVGNMFAICPNHHAEVSRGIIQLFKVDDQTLKIALPV